MLHTLNLLPIGSIGRTSTFAFRISSVFVSNFLDYRPISAARKNEPVIQTRSLAVADLRAAFQASVGSLKVGQRGRSIPRRPVATLGRHGPRIVRITREIQFVKMADQALDHAVHVFVAVVAKISNRRTTEKLSSSVSTRAWMDATLWPASNTTAGRRDTTCTRAGQDNPANAR